MEASRIWRNWSTASRSRRSPSAPCRAAEGPGRHVVIISITTGKVLGVWNSLCSGTHHLLRPARCPRSDSAIFGARTRFGVIEIRTSRSSVVVLLPGKIQFRTGIEFRPGMPDEVALDAIEEEDPEEADTDEEDGEAPD